MLRRRMMMAQGGVSLPAGYTKLEYLESDGNHYIDTGFIPNENTRTVVKYQFLSTATEWTCLVGSRNYWDNTQGYSFWRTTEGQFIVSCGVAGEIIYFSTTDDLGIHSIDINKDVATLDSSETVNTGISGLVGTYPIWLFCVNEFGSVGYPSAARIYSCQIYDNGVKVRDYVPCTNEAGVNGLYDTVNGVFYPLHPAGYTRLDFIETNGTQYIDTGFAPNQDTRVVMDAYVLDGSNVDWITLFGARSESYARCFGAFAPGSLTTTAQQYMFNYGGAEAYYVDTNPFQRRLVDFDKNVISIDGVVAITAPAATFQTSVSLYLFATNDDDIASFLHKVRVYSCKIYDNGTLIRDYIPAMNASGTAGLYDLVNDVFYPLQQVVTKVENRITMSYEIENRVSPSGIVFVYTYVYLATQYAVASDITVNLKSINLGNTDYLTIYADTTNAGGGMSPNFGIPSITSISPTEDDTYIYTF